MFILFILLKLFLGLGMLGFGRERGFDLMGIVRGFVLIIGFFFIGCVFDDGMLVLNGFKGDLYEWSIVCEKEINN